MNPPPTTPTYYTHTRWDWFCYCDQTIDKPNELEGNYIQFVYEVVLSFVDFYNLYKCSSDAIHKIYIVYVKEKKINRNNEL